MENATVLILIGIVVFCFVSYRQGKLAGRLEAIEKHVLPVAATASGGLSTLMGKLQAKIAELEQPTKPSA